jgi:hypothetical protein
MHRASDMTNRLIAILAFIVAGADRERAAAQSPPPPAALDSIVLERTPCYGTCAAYRLTVTRSGVVMFLSRNRGDSSRAARDSITPDAVVQLVQAAERDDVFRLPAVIADDRALCADRATDHPTAIVGLFWSSRVQQITDYHGCFLRSDHSTAAPLAALRQFEKAIDSVSGSARWTRPNRFR